jgi:hypothetical protein
MFFLEFVRPSFEIFNDGSLSMLNGLDVKGPASFLGALTLGSDMLRPSDASLRVQGDTELSGGLRLHGSAIFFGDFALSGSLSVNSLAVSGDATIAGGLFVDCKVLLRC